LSLVNIAADFSGIVKVLTSIDMTLKHAVRILETAFPMQPERSWTGRSESSKVQVIDDETAIRHEEEDDKKPKENDVRVYTDELADFYDLEERTDAEKS
jgi:hypothetical protein